MNNLIVKEFNGNKIYTFIWNNKPCWIANQIVSMFGYAEPKVTINQCIESEEFEIGVEYEILKFNELKQFKELVKNTVTSSEVINKHTPQLIIFYEDGLYGFLQYTDKPIGVQFRKWLRRDVLPEIREHGAYITNNANVEYLKERVNDIEKLQLAYNSTNLFKELLDNAGLDDKVKLLTAKTIYKKAGIDLPIQIEEEEHFYDTKQIATILGVYSKSNKPAFQAVGEIIKKLDISDTEIKAVWESNGSWCGTVNKYKKFSNNNS